MILNLTERRIEELLEKITYKPGWKLTTKSPYKYSFKQRKDWGDPIYIYCTVMASDVNNGNPIMLNLQCPIGPSYGTEITDKNLITLIANVVRRFEEHEFREWFKIDGFQVFDPHPELRTKEEVFRGYFSDEDSRCC